MRLGLLGPRGAGRRAGQDQVLACRVGGGEQRTGRLAAGQRLPGRARDGLDLRARPRCRRPARRTASRPARAGSRGSPVSTSEAAPARCPSPARTSRRPPASSRRPSPGWSTACSSCTGRRTPRRSPVQDANSPNARSPTVSTSVTRSPSVATWAQVLAAVVVAYSSGPNAHPSAPFRNRIWLTPAAPSGGPASGAGTPLQVFPASSVRATEVQYCGGAIARRPGLADDPAGAGADEGGRGGPEAAARAPAPGPGRRPPSALTARALAAVVRGGRGRVRRAARRSPGFSTGRLTTCGTVDRGGHDHRRRARGDSQPAVLAPPGPPLDQIERARRRGQRLDPPVQPGIQVVAPVSHRGLPARCAAWRAPRTGRP